LRSFVDRKEHLEFVREKLDRELSSHYKDPTAPWHWKCPASAFFLPTWLEVFPEAYFILITRDPVDQAKSYLKRGEFSSIQAIMDYISMMQEHIERHTPVHFLHVRYETNSRNIDRMIDYLPYEVSREQKMNALGVIKPSSPKLRNPDLSIRNNYYSGFCLENVS